MRYYIIAGEASGDLHGSNLIRELRARDSLAQVRCWGGDLMQAAGGELVRHYRDLAFMGFVEVVSNLGTILRNLKFCKQDIRAFRPDTLVLIDYPGFNLRIARWAHEQGIRVIYYISPQVWAWKENRVRMMKQCIDRMLVILPFEKAYFRDKWHWEVDYVGHPLVEVIEKYQARGITTRFSERPVIALLPGSRRQEIEKKLPIMLEVSRAFPDYQFIVAQAPSIEPAFYETFTRPFPNVSAVSNQTYELLLQARAALVTSGTATLETALFGVPEVVCYKGSPISYQIARRVIRVSYISLVNLIMNKLVVRELIQQELTPDNIRQALQELLNDPARQAALSSDYQELKRVLREGGNASAQAARLIVETVTTWKGSGN